MIRFERKRAIGHLQPGAPGTGSAVDPNEECPIETAEWQYRDDRLSATYRPAGLPAIRRQLSHMEGV